MKYPIYIIFIAFSILSCKNEKKDSGEMQLTIAQKIANAHGFQNWDKVYQINFTFNVDRDSSHFERTWQWEPKTNNVIMISKGDTIVYNRSQIDSTNLNTDKAFINDKYWLLAPFNLVWDKGTTISDPIKEEAPIGKKELYKIMLTYPTEGGYTPGDAYDFYYGDDFIIKEWTFRRSNSSEPTLSTTWEDYKDYNGIKIALKHNRLETNRKLYFSNVKVTLE
ncbi:MAG: hypothetical protein KAJ28_00145 [Flavobacteriaceae bacterium]|nr:hypothetical protein [Flavobacteriaceae bacterium]